MDASKLKVLLVVEQCNPDWFSVPLEGYWYYEGIQAHADVTLVTHSRNREALTKKHPDREIHYMEDSDLIVKWAALAEKFSKIKGNTIWPLYLSLSYPVYAAFNRKVYNKYRAAVEAGEFDIVHAITPMMPRFPVKIVKACKQTPFVIGPVNGGVPYPEGFKEVANQEFAFLNFFRELGRFLLPGYKATYEKAAKVLAGSTYTLGLLKEYFSLKSDSLELFYENGIKTSFLQATRGGDPSAKASSKVHLLFVGRLVPYKGADMLLEALGQLTDPLKDQTCLTIVGDGSERQRLEALVDKYQLRAQVEFAGWVNQDDTLAYYQRADLFCFPSVREFGGAVVLEAMANHLPCVVVNNGGIGEYVTAETGFKIDPISRDYVVEHLTRCISTLLKNSSLRKTMSEAAYDYVKQFTWEAKAEKMMAVYQTVLAKY